MRFGKKISGVSSSSQKPFVSYKLLKKLIKMVLLPTIEEEPDATQDEATTKPGLTLAREKLQAQVASPGIKFFEILNLDLSVIGEYVTQQLDSLETILGEVQITGIAQGIFFTPHQSLIGVGARGEEVKPIRFKGGAPEERLSNFVTLSNNKLTKTDERLSVAVGEMAVSMRKAVEDLNELTEYLDMNCAAFRKILKKYAKKTEDRERSLPDYPSSLVGMRLQVVIVGVHRLKQSVVSFCEAAIEQLDPGTLKGSSSVRKYQKALQMFPRLLPLGDELCIAIQQVKGPVGDIRFHLSKEQGAGKGVHYRKSSLADSMNSSLALDCELATSASNPSRTLLRDLRGSERSLTGGTLDVYARPSDEVREVGRRRRSSQKSSSSTGKGRAGSTPKTSPMYTSGMSPAPSPTVSLFPYPQAHLYPFHPPYLCGVLSREGELRQGEVHRNLIGKPVDPRAHPKGGGGGKPAPSIPFQVEPFPSQSAHVGAPPAWPPPSSLSEGRRKDEAPIPLPSTSQPSPLRSLKRANSAPLLVEALRKGRGGERLPQGREMREGSSPHLTMLPLGHGRAEGSSPSSPLRFLNPEPFRGEATNRAELEYVNPRTLQASITRPGVGGERSEPRVSSIPGQAGGAPGLAGYPFHFAGPQQSPLYPHPPSQVSMLQFPPFSQAPHPLPFHSGVPVSLSFLPFLDLRVKEEGVYSVPFPPPSSSPPPLLPTPPTQRTGGWGGKGKLGGKGKGKGKGMGGG